ncbi:MAG: hypothetical protein ABSB58_03980 [Gemmatimonadales bacterium]
MSRPTVDPGRLIRALGLTVEPGPRGTWYVQGGAAAHVVRRRCTGWTCDCLDGAFHPGQPCKHRLAVALNRLPPPIRAALRDVVPLPRRARRMAAAP